MCSETKSQHIACNDKLAAGIFGDGSFGMLAGPSPQGEKNDFSKDHFYWVDAFVDSSVVGNIQVKREFGVDVLRLTNGKLMYRKTVQYLCEMISRCIAEALLRNLEIQNVFLHQANANILHLKTKRF